MGREENVEIFKRTESLCKTDETLKKAIREASANQKLILETDAFQPPEREVYREKAKVAVSRKRSLEAASGYQGKKVCVHNFASATSPGGGVVKGSSAQEECLCRCSTLYFGLNTKEMWDGFYGPHRASQDPVHKDDCIYTPGVVAVCTDTASPQLLKPEERYFVNVITCAAPNLRQMPANRMNPGDGTKRVKMLPDELQALHEKRLTRILDIALSEGNEVVILGAFGCGAFENDPRIVVKAARNVIEKYLHAFQAIEFAVYCSPRDDSNYRIFKEGILSRR